MSALHLLWLLPVAILFELAVWVHGHYTGFKDGLKAGKRTGGTR